MILGLDVGGTHTDVVLIKDKKILKTVKVITNHDDLVKSIYEAITKVMVSISDFKLSKVNLSTTLATNAIVNDKVDPVCVIVSSGPGIDSKNFKIGQKYFNVDGSIDHRGDQVLEIDYNKLKDIQNELKNSEIDLFSVISKFSTRNSSHERGIGKEIESLSLFTSYGHRLSGTLNFPARIFTAYFNSSVWKIYDSFANAIEKSRKKFNLPDEINILKADGGTISLEKARSIPVETILSGPAATNMGIISLCNIDEDFLVLDIGGTTTDISFFTNKSPIIEKDGAVIMGRKTLVRSIKTLSVGIGGDSVILIDNDDLTVGPARVGPSMAEGGEFPTLVDLFNSSNDFEFKNYNKSKDGINDLSKKGKFSFDQIVQMGIDYAVDKIYKTSLKVLNEINERPLYTIHEVLENEKLNLQKIVIVGGPAKMIEKYISKKFNLPVIIPENYIVANAIGAALAKNTVEIELFADTSRSFLSIPVLDIYKKVDLTYTIEEAKKDAILYLYEHCIFLGLKISKEDIDITEQSSFNIIEGYGMVGRDIRVKSQIKADVNFKLFENGDDCESR